MKLVRCAALFLACATAVLAQNPVNAAAAADSLPPLTHFDAKLVDTAADPCVDFHQYACGKIIANTPIAATKRRLGNAVKLIHWNEAVLHQILMDAAAKKTGRTPNEQKIGDYWTACMDEAATKANGLKMLRPQLDAINQMKSKAQLADLVAKAAPDDSRGMGRGRCANQQRALRLWTDARLQRRQQHHRRL